MCDACFKMTRRQFNKASLATATVVAAGALPGPGFANLAAFSVPGEERPRFTGTNQADLDKYRHNRITHIAFHHEGFADGKRSLFDARQPGRAETPAEQRVRNIQPGHVARGFGMVAYHYGVGATGDIAKARPLDYAPGTGSTDPRTGGIANFDGHFAVVALADFDFENVVDREDQIFSMIKIMSEAQRFFRVPTNNIKSHRDQVTLGNEFGSSCPGKNLQAIRANVVLETQAVSLQTELAAKGCYTAGIDGDFGPRSRAALSQFSSRHPQLGSLGLNDQTLWKLMDAPNDRCV